MYSFLARNGQLFGFGLGIAITLIVFIIIGMNSSFLSANSEDSAAIAQTGIFNFPLIATFGLVLLCVAAMFIFGIIGIVSDFKGAMKGLIGIGALLLVFVICYVLSGGAESEVVTAAIDKYNADLGDGANETWFSWITAGKSRLVGAGLLTTVGLAVIAFIGLFVSEILNFFR